MRVTIKDDQKRPPPDPIVQFSKKKSRESYAAIIRPESQQLEFVTMSQTVTLKEISLRMSKHATPKYLPHVAEAEDYQFYAYVDEMASKVNEFGTKVAKQLGFDINGDIHGPLVLLGPPTGVSTATGQPFDEKTKCILEKKIK